VFPNPGTIIQVGIAQNEGLQQVPHQNGARAHKNQQQHHGLVLKGSSWGFLWIFYRTSQENHRKNEAGFAKWPRKVMI
jgi:hypothetical protein